MAKRQIIHAALAGVDMSVPAYRLPPSWAARAVNRTFRNGGNATRPGWDEPMSMFESPEDEALFRNGNMQGLHAYTPTGTAEDSALLLAVGGTVFHGRIAGNAIVWTAVDRGLNPMALSVVFAQGEEQVYWQDGLSRPRGWGGLGTEVRILDHPDHGMPIGVLMAYAHGRIVVITEEGGIFISDHFNAAGFGVRTNMDKFTENDTYLGGYFFAPSSMGRARFLTVAPYNNNWFAQGELVIGYENGFAAMDISTAREDWQPPRVTFSGAGAVSPRGYCHASSQIWYRRHDGIGTYDQGRQDFANGTGSPVSENIRPIIDTDTKGLLRFIPMSFFDSRVFCGCSPTRVQQGDVWRVFCEKMVVADISRGTPASQDAPFAWEGEWTGVRPFAMVTFAAEGVTRMFVADVSVGMQNRVLELGGTKVDNLLEGGAYVESRIESSFTVANPTGGESFFTPLRFTGIGKIGIVHHGDFEAKAFWQSESMPPEVEILSASTPSGLDCFASCSSESFRFFRIPRWLRTQTPGETICQAFSKRPATTGVWSLVRYQFAGDVDFVGAIYLVDDTGDPTTCNDNAEFDYSPIEGFCPESNL